MMPGVTVRAMPKCAVKTASAKRAAMRSADGCAAGATCGHSATPASLSPQWDDQQSRVQRGHENPAPHTNIILQSRERERRILVKAGVAPLSRSHGRTPSIGSENFFKVLGCFDGVVFSDWRTARAKPYSTLGRNFHMGAHFKPGLAMAGQFLLLCHSHSCSDTR
jgi:hypothetical protein